MKDGTLTYLFAFVLTSAFFISCEKEEKPLSAPSLGDLETVTITMEYPYLYQVYYSCDQNEVVNTNERYDWDIAFECTPNGHQILLNIAKATFVADKETTPWGQITDTIGSVWSWDATSGNPDSLALKNWYDPISNTYNNHTYIIDRGYNSSGSHMGFVKVQFNSVTTNGYEFTFANLDGTNEQQITIPKISDYNHLCFSFDNGGEIKYFEPHKDQWDLLFTNFQYKFSNLPMPFIITGVFSNSPNGVWIAEDNNNNFDNITLSDTSNYIFTNQRDEIGYDWKIKLPDNNFIIDINKSYIVKSTSGLFYKIRFIDFYNSTGSKGYPKFEIQKL